MSKTHGQNGSHTAERTQAQKPKLNGGRSYFGTVNQAPETPQIGSPQVHQVMPEDVIKNPRQSSGGQKGSQSKPVAKSSPQQKRS